MRKLNHEKLLNTLDKLKGCILIVEGMKDEKALKSLGLKSIIKISGKPLIRVVHEVENEIKRGKRKKDVIILTDFDSKGRKIAARLRYLLQKYKIHPNSRLRGEVMKLGWNKIEDMNNLRFEQPAQQALTGGDDHVKIGTDINKIHDKGSHKGKRRSRKTRHNRSDIWSD
ncbi:MAG: toprim domain-containing protein [Candidatus Aenigmatarchaeota archaeon]|nr:MAG: toprim domain-containing protein [Candidatus Aenigmarchaeota archaeon]